jgi:hypothetical protein
MIAWASIKERDSRSGAREFAHNNSDELGNHARFEYQIRCDYESAIQRLSSASVNSVSWNTIRESLEKILLDLNSFTNLEQKTQLTYLTLKNLSLMKDQQGDSLGAFQDAIKALSHSDFKDETALLVRIAYLSLHSNEIWTCQALLSSGHLARALRPIYDDLSRKCQKALLSDLHCPTQEKKSSFKSIPILTIRFNSISTSSRLLHLLLEAFSSLKTSDVLEYCQSGFFFINWEKEFEHSIVVDNVQQEIDHPCLVSGGELRPDDDPSRATSVTEENETKLRKSSRQLPRKVKDGDFDSSSNVVAAAFLGTESKSGNCWEAVSNELQNYLSVR